MELPRQIPYNPSWLGIVVCGGFFGACAAFAGYTAVHNRAGLILNGIITLEPGGATVFYWGMFAIGAGFVLVTVMLAGRRMLSPLILEIGTESLLLPHGLLQSQTSEIAYRDIERVAEAKVSGQTLLYVTARGRRYTITASLLPDADTYLAVRAFLISRAAKDDRSAANQKL